MTRKTIVFILILSMLISMLPQSTITVHAGMNENAKVHCYIDGTTYTLDETYPYLVKTSGKYGVAKTKPTNDADCLADLDIFFGRLTLNNYNGGPISFSNDAGDVKLYLNGSNKITTTGFGLAGPYGGNGSLEITGFGTLSITTSANNSASIGIFAPKGDLKISANVNVSSTLNGSYSICYGIAQNDSSKSLIISGGNINTTATGVSATAIKASGTLNISGNANVVAKTNCNTIDTNYNIKGIHGDKNIKIFGNSRVEVLTNMNAGKTQGSKDDYGIYCNQNIEIDTKDNVYIQMKGNKAYSEFTNKTPIYDVNSYEVGPVKPGTGLMDIAYIMILQAKALL